MFLPSLIGSTPHPHDMISNIDKTATKEKKTKREECVLAIIVVSVDIRLSRISGANCDDSKKSWFRHYCVS
jgi:hypothetical protein